MVERCALSGSDLKIEFRTILLTSILTSTDGAVRPMFFFSKLSSEGMQLDIFTSALKESAYEIMHHFVHSSTLRLCTIVEMSTSAIT